MTDPTTSNRSYAVPTRGSDVGVWDTPLNTNFGLLDNNLGGVATIALSNQPVTLTPAQYQCGTIRLTGALTANVTITFPSVQGWWLIDNQTTGAFVALLTCGSGNNIATEPGVATDIFTDGTNVGFRDLGKIGGYWDYAGASVPLWVSACTIPPFLNCNGGTFSAQTYPYLASILGRTTLPDLRGVMRATLNQGTSRITSASGIDGDTRFSVGGSQLMQNHNHSGSGTTGTENQSHSHNYSAPSINSSTGGGPFGIVGSGSGATTDTENQSHNHSFSFTTSTSGGGGSQNMPPTTIGGITMIRAA